MYINDIIIVRILEITDSLYSFIENPYDINMNNFDIDIFINKSFNTHVIG